MTDSIWIQCEEIGCPNGIGVWHKHAPNFIGRFWCPAHDSDELNLTADEVPC